MKQSMDGELLGLANRQDEIAYRTAVLRMLAIVQRVHQNYELPRLAQAIIEMLEPVMTSFHNTTMRDHIRSEIAKYAAGCRFDEMLVLLDSGGPLRQGDTNGFAHAVQNYASLERGRNWLVGGGLTEQSRVRAIAQRVAAITATLISSTCLAAYGVYAVLF
jgi:predicted GTPase